MTKKYFLIFLFLIAAVSMVSCGLSNKDRIVSSNANQTSSEASTAVRSPAVPTTTDSSPVPAASSQFNPPVFGTRPIAVMIDNEGTRSLPQGGIDKAQLVYEIIVEGGETRIMPVFWNTDPKMIGSVRSARHYFLDYALEHDAIYVHFGWSPMAQSDISKLKINNINGITNGGEIFWDLTKDRNNWQDSYTSMAKIQAYIKKIKYRSTTDKELVFQYNQEDTDLSNGTKAGKITLRYSASYTCGYEYNSDTETYKRFRKGNPQMERVTGKQLEVKNIIVQYTPNYSIKGDRQGRQEVKTTGSGKGYLITCGKVVKIKWSKDKRNSQTKYTDEAGNTILLNPGQTWIQILPWAGKVSIS